MKRWIFVVTALVTLCAAEAQEEGFEPLVTKQDGKYSKAGWNHYGPGNFELDRSTGVLRTDDGLGLFWYAGKQFGDFVLELDYLCIEKASDSGIFLRIPMVPASDAYAEHAFEVQILDAGEGVQQTGGIYDAVAPSELAAKSAGEWNHLKVTFQGNRITVVLNGKQVTDWEAEPRGRVRDFAPRGYIGLQNHDTRSLVFYKNIYVKELP